VWRPFRPRCATLPRAGDAVGLAARLCYELSRSALPGGVLVSAAARRGIADDSVLLQRHPRLKLASSPRPRLWTGARGGRQGPLSRGTVSSDGVSPTTGFDDVRRRCRRSCARAVELSSTSTTKSSASPKSRARTRGARGVGHRQRRDGLVVAWVSNRVCRVTSAFLPPFDRFSALYAIPL
jgi:hypothetical protein